MRIVILGGGINGFSCALKLQKHFSDSKNTEISLISEAFSPNTTGDGSAGLWGPYLLGGTSTAKVYKWSKGMHDFLQELWLSEDAGVAGVCLIPVIRLTTTQTPVEDFWKDIVYGAQPLSQKILDEYNEGRKIKYTSGLHFVTYTSEPLKLLPYLMKRFEQGGGKIIQQTIHNLDAFVASSSYDVVINCTGLGAQQMLPDLKMYSVRGQVTRVKAPWMYLGVLDESDVGNYIIPNMNTVVLGGTHQEHDYNTMINAVDKNFIMNGCAEIVPALKHAEHQFDWVGLRPGRSELRLEGETRGNKFVIHNYGHGGSGVTLAWGCAEDVLDILTEHLKKTNTVTSKL